MDYPSAIMADAQRRLDHNSSKILEYLKREKQETLKILQEMDKRISYIEKEMENMKSGMSRANAVINLHTPIG